MRPRILGTPVLDRQAVTDAMVAVARKLRAMVYAAAQGDTIGEAQASRNYFGASELMLLRPNWKALKTGAGVLESPAAARVLGLRTASTPSRVGPGRARRARAERQDSPRNHQHDDGGRTHGDAYRQAQGIHLDSVGAGHSARRGAR